MRTTRNVQRIHVEPDPYDDIFISQGFRIDDLLIVSGQPANYGDGPPSDDFETQGHEAFANLARILEAGGSSLENVLKVTIFVTDMSHYEIVRMLRRRYFAEPYPADSIVEVKALARPGLQIEIEAIALAVT
jgi:enamine deaminase RidA (YjgF/YER057c/UK114 family)